MSRVFVGLSGYSYKPWQGEGRFYPADLKQTQFLPYYAEHYPAVEMDGTWYRHPTEKAVADWMSRTPPGFRFSFKLHRKITHETRLKPEGFDSLRFMLSRLVPIAREGKLAPLLIQLPPNLRRNDERLTTFLENLPRDMGAIQGGAPDLPLRWCIEFRSDTWHSPEIEELLTAHGIAWVASDTDEANAQRRDTAAGHFYVRLRKTEYSREDLYEWAAYFESLARLGKEGYVYCKHEDDQSPWIWADTLMERLGPISVSAQSAPSEPARC